MKQEINLSIVANAALGSGLSGGDRIFIELARRWAEKGCKINIYVWEEGYQMCRKNNLDKVRYVVWPIKRYKCLGFYLHYLIRTIKGMMEAAKVENNGIDIVYSASNFWPDFFPALIMKKRLKNSKFIGAHYLSAPNPFTKETPYRGRRFISGLFHYLSEKPVYWLIKRYADVIFVTSEPDKEKFVLEGFPPKDIIIIKGGVDTKTPKTVPEPLSKKFDAVFIGRLHSQKGVLELIEIWKYVTKKKKDSRLIIIGDGPLENEVKAKVEKLGLSEHIHLVGFKDGLEKIKIFKSSRIVVHPAIYDSGGMAPCEAMACGLPGVAFDLDALRTYYPKGMIKTPKFDLQGFADNIVELLENEKLYNKTKEDAIEWALEWDWDEKADYIFNAILVRTSKMMKEDV